jgi:hypothetical protein
MPKFYVQSGDVSLVVSAMDAEGAALWAIHQHSRLPESAGQLADESAELPDWDDLLPDFAAELPELGKTISVSERGSGRAEAGRFATDAALAKYGQLLVAVERLLEAQSSSRD